MQNNMIAAERRRLICDRALRNKSVNATELAETLHVGISTIRRDLDALDAEGKLIRVHGGALARETVTPRVPYSQSRDKNTSQKAAVAEAALAYVPKTGAIFIGGGTTTYQLAIRLRAGRDISIVTNGLDIAAHLASNRVAAVDLVGGTIRADSLQTNCEEALETLFWDVTFMGLAAVDISRGVSTDNRATACQERLIRQHGNRFVALCDSSKIGRFVYAQVAQVSAIDVFITDPGADQGFVKQLQDQGVEVVVAGPLAD